MLPQLTLICFDHTNNDMFLALLSFRLFIVMHRDQQKKDDSQDQFQQMQQEVETINACKMDSPPKNLKNNPRLHYLAQKYKLGLLHSLQPLEIASLHPRKQSPIAIGKIIRVGSTTFRSNFESGSLGSVDLVGINTFRITLDAETNSSRGNAWFDFIVEGVRGEAYFTITGFRKRASLYTEGMKICYREAGEESTWKRGGTHICYSKEKDKEEGSRFEVRFAFYFKPTDHNSVEFAYCFPYGPTKLQDLLASVHAKTKVQTIASSFEGVDLPLINLGNLSSKEVIVVCARVHPGEAVSSFIMEGLIKELVSESESARFLREKFLFKIMPMINVDGVRHGNFRFSASGVDLNRRWKSPSEEHHPEIYYLKQMILREHKQKRVRMFIDMHGHSRKKNVFFYGCCRETQNLSDNFHPKAFPFLTSKLHQPYAYQDCSFNVQPQKDGTARIALWNELKIHEVYTLEASFCSSTNGSNYYEADYQKMGHKLCESMALYFYQSCPKYPHLAKALTFREKVYAELRSNPLLLKQGNEENSGSDSEPEKGERQEQKLAQRRQSSLPGGHSAISHAKQEVEQSGARNHTNKTSLASHQEVPQVGQLSLKHKSETAANDDHAQIEPEHIRHLFPPLPAFTLKTEVDPQIPDRQRYVPEATKHAKARPPTKVTSVPPTKLSLYSEQDLPNGEEPHKKDKRIVSAFENAQYRRIKHMVEQRFAEKNRQETPVTLVQSINTRKIEVEPPRQGAVAGFYGNTPMRRRKSSVEAFYNKPSKSVGRKKEAPNVMCRGRQIVL